MVVAAAVSATHHTDDGSASSTVNPCNCHSCMQLLSHYQMMPSPNQVQLVSERIDRHMALDGKLEKIKENVWKLEKDGKHFSVKRYHSNSTAMKVQRLHDALHSVSFPHIVRLS